jgi:hypothetical protein
LFASSFSGVLIDGHMSEETPRERLLVAAGRWIKGLQDYPGWREWQRKKFHKVLWEDWEPRQSHIDQIGDFEFDAATDAEHAVVHGFYCLISTVNSFKDLEYYFRRCPFRGLPVSRHEHLANVCEMYFSRFYEFRARAKNLLNAANATAPRRSIEVGQFIKLYDRMFDVELRERNSVHHRLRFSDLDIDRMMLEEWNARVTGRDDHLRRYHADAYRRVASKWASRVRDRAKLLDEIVDRIADGILQTCAFLNSPPGKLDRNENGT